MLAWQWNVPPTEADHTGLLVIMDSPEDPILESNRVLHIEGLVTDEKRVG
jgi:hypothetical protein